MRDGYGLHANNGILFNHSGPRRGIEFVTQKVASAAAKYSYWCTSQKNGALAPALFIGNMNAKRDIGDARDYVRGMWLMLQQDKPDDYVLATGQAYSVREMIEICFHAIGCEITWQGGGMNEGGFDEEGNQIVVVDSSFYRPTEVDCLIGNAGKARQVLGWKPEIGFKEMLEEMVENAIHNL
jgi:GDPmannose 4,6-dehydratase